MDASSAIPDRQTVIDAGKDIASSTVEDKDELLASMLCRAYPLPASQSN